MRSDLDSWREGLSQTMNTSEAARTILSSTAAIQRTSVADAVAKMAQEALPVEWKQFCELASWFALGKGPEDSARKLLRVSSRNFKRSGSREVERMWSLQSCFKNRFIEECRSGKYQLRAYAVSQIEVAIPLDLIREPDDLVLDGEADDVELAGLKFRGVQVVPVERRVPDMSAA